MHQNSIKEFGTALDRRSMSKRVAVILAGGEGSRLRSLTKLIAGDDRPKQFCPILGGRTLLDVTRERTALTIDPQDTYFSLTAGHSRYFERPLWNVPQYQKIIQPTNRGTAPAILYSAMRVAAESPDAMIAFLPSDHYFSDDEAFMANVNRAFDAVRLNPKAIVLLGIEPDKPEPSYGWIEPVDSLFGELPRSISRVKQFWEKPTTGVAKLLMVNGCLWNSFVMVGKVETFLDRFRECLPGMFRMFDAARRSFGTREEAAVIRSIYAWIEDTNFSSDVLERSAERLLVQRVSDVRWSDWGVPQRVVGTLTDLGIQTEWMRALAA